VLAPAWQARPAEQDAGARRPGATTVTGAARTGSGPDLGTHGRLTGRAGEADVKCCAINAVPRTGHLGPAVDRQVAGNERDV